METYTIEGMGRTGEKATGTLLERIEKANSKLGEIAVELLPKPTDVIYTVLAQREGREPLGYDSAESFEGAMLAATAANPNQKTYGFRVRNVYKVTEKQIEALSSPPTAERNPSQGYGSTSALEKVLFKR